jgi:spatacsin
MRFLWQVNLLILAHQYYESSGCLDGLDVLVGLAATRVDAYVAEGDFVSLTLLVIGLNNLQALRFVLDILIENGQLEMLLENTKTLDVVDGDFKSKRAIQGFRMGILSSLYHFNPQDQDAFSLVSTPSVSK